MTSFIGPLNKALLKKHLSKLSMDTQNRQLFVDLLCEARGFGDIREPGFSGLWRQCRLQKPIKNYRTEIAIA